MDQLKGLVPKVVLFVSGAQPDSGSCFDETIAALCLGVREHGSLGAAARNMGMAYSRAWRITKEAETGLGFSLFERLGCRGSKLTPEGEQLLEAYLDIEERLDAKAAAMLQKIVP